MVVANELYCLQLLYFCLFFNSLALRSLITMFVETNERIDLFQSLLSKSIQVGLACTRRQVVDHLWYHGRERGLRTKRSIMWEIRRYCTKRSSTGGFRAMTPNIVLLNSGESTVTALWVSVFWIRVLEADLQISTFNINILTESGFDCVVCRITNCKIFQI